MDQPEPIVKLGSLSAHCVVKLPGTNLWLAHVVVTRSLIDGEVHVEFPSALHPNGDATALAILRQHVMDAFAAFEATGSIYWTGARK